MLEDFKKKLQTFNIYYLMILAAFCFLAVILGVLGFIYDVLLLGLMLGGDISARETMHTVVQIIFSGGIFIFLLNIISHKKKILRSAKR